MAFGILDREDIVVNLRYLFDEVQYFYTLKYSSKIKVNDNVER